MVINIQLYFLRGKMPIVRGMLTFVEVQESLLNRQGKNQPPLPAKRVAPAPNEK
jgi:hypothetical protein